MKETFYLRHDYNSRNDENVLKLRQSYPNGEGYGAYWMILEKLAESSEGRIKLSDIDIIAFDLHLDSKRIRDVIFNFGLFQFDKNYFWSNRLLSDLAERNQKSARAILANKIRWSKANNNPNGLQMDSDLESKERKGKERKERKKEKIEKEKFGKFQNVLLTPEEFSKLNSELGEETAGKLIDELDLGIGSKGYKYQSHYLTILNWNRRRKEQNGPAKKYKRMEDTEEWKLYERNQPLA